MGFWRRAIPPRLHDLHRSFILSIFEFLPEAIKLRLSGSDIISEVCGHFSLENILYFL